MYKRQAEDVVEIQCHGGIVPVRQILKLLVNHDVRMAEAGEFTKRAFMNGRIDLTQAEAIIDIIEAKTEDSLSLAVSQLDGTVSSFVKDVREQLIAMTVSYTHLSDCNVGVVVSTVLLGATIGSSGIFTGAGVRSI